MAVWSRKAAIIFLTLQVSVSFVIAGGSSTGDSDLDGFFVGFSFKKPATKPNTTAIRQAVAETAGVPADTITAADVKTAFRNTKPRLGAKEAAFKITVVNLAAPYARLTALQAENRIKAALREAKIQYINRSLQVAAPAWIQQTDTLADTDENSMRMVFTMSGVALPNIDQYSLRVAIAAVAGVRYEEVRIKTVSYSVAPQMSKVLQNSTDIMPATSGYKLLQVVVAVNSEAAMKAGQLQSATVAQSLAEQLKVRLGATLNEGSLLVDQMPGVKTETKEDRRKTLGVTLGVSLAVLLVAIICCVSVVVWYRRKARAAAATGVHPLSKLTSADSLQDQEMGLSSADMMSYHLKHSSIDTASLAEEKNRKLES